MGMDFLSAHFLTQDSNRGLLLCRQILYQLSYHLNKKFTTTTPPQQKNGPKVFCKLLGHNINIRESVLKHKCYQSPRNESQVRQFPKVPVHPMRQ